MTEYWIMLWCSCAEFDSWVRQLHLYDAGSEVTWSSYVWRHMFVIHDVSHGGICLWSTAYVLFNKNKTLSLAPVKPRLHDTTGCQAVVQPFDNRLYRVNKHQTGLTTGWMFVYTIQPVVKQVWQPIWQPVWQPIVSCI